MIPKIMHQSAKELTWEERRITSHARRLMPDWTYKFWSDADNLALFESIFPQYRQQFLDMPAGVIRADISRCLYLHQHGGVYFDTDYIFYKAPDEKFLSQKCILGIEEESHPAFGGQPKLGNAFMASEPGFPLWKAFVETTFKRFEAGERNVLFLGGPHALSLFLTENPAYRDGITVLPQSHIYPDFRLMKLTTERTPETIGGHMCWGSWRNKNKLAQLKNRARRVLSVASL